MPPPVEEIEWEGRPVSCWTYDQLGRLSKLNLRQRAMNLRDLIGAQKLPPLRTTSQPETMIQWILDVQLMLCAAVGIPEDACDFGGPKNEDAGVPYFGPTPGARPSSQLATAPVDISGDMNPEWSADRVAHEQSLVVAQRARQRNQGSFTFGAEPEPSAPPPPAQAAPWMPSSDLLVGRSDMLPRDPHAGRAEFHPMPQAPRDTMAQPPPESSRPGTAFSDVSTIAANEANSNRLRNLGSFAFG
jgi:hypothetical protein